MSFSRNIWLLLVQNLAIFIGFGTQQLLLNLYLRELGYREDFLGLVAFATTVAVSVAALPAGAFSNRIGPRRSLIVGTSLVAIGGLTVVAGTDPALIVVSMALAGIGQALIFVPMGPYMMENLRPADVQRAFGVNFALISFGSVIGSIVGGLVPRLVAGGLEPGVEGYRVSLIVGAILSGLGTIAMLLAREPTSTTRSLVTTRAGPRPTGQRASAAERSIVRDLIILTGGNALLAAATALIASFFNIYLRDRTGASTEAVGLVYAIGAAATVPASLLAEPIAKRLGTVPVIVAMRLLAVPILLVPLLSSSFAAGLIVYTFRSALVSMTFPLDNAYVMSLAPSYLRARFAAFRTMSWNLGWALSTAAAGAVIVLWGYAPIFVGAAVLTVASALIYVLVTRQTRPVSPP